MSRNRQGDTMTPAQAGYVRCVRCNVWMPPEYVRAVPDAPGVSIFDMVAGESLTPHVCVDVAWCSTMAGAGLGRLDADVGAGTTNYAKPGTGEGPPR